MRLLLCQAFLGLLAFDLLGLNSDFARMHKTVRDWKLVRRSSMPDTTERVCRAVNRASLLYPKRVLCLQRSAVTTCLLRLHGVEAKMVMGVQLIPFKAHAWTEINGKVINERREVQKVYATWERC